jgi:hypothetical protein
MYGIFDLLARVERPDAPRMTCERDDLRLLRTPRVETPQLDDFRAGEPQPLVDVRTQPLEDSVQMRADRPKLLNADAP